MTSNISTSRIAITIVALLILFAGLWMLWPTNQDPDPSKSVADPLNRTNTEEISVESEAQSSMDLKANQATNLNKESGSRKISESKKEIASGQSHNSKVQPSDTEVNQKDVTSSDFRVSADDKYASVPAGRFFTTTGITELSPDGAVYTFHIGQRVYAYAAIQAPRKETVRITWFDSDKKEILPSAYLDVEVNTGPVGYRVFTYRIFRSPGTYSVTLSNSTDAVIGEIKFKVE
jgi:hypothetical protein